MQDTNTNTMLTPIQKRIASFALRTALTAVLALWGSTTQAQRTYDFKFEDGLSTKVTILEDSPSKITRGCFSLYPLVFGGFGGAYEEGAYGPFSIALSYWRWTKDRRHLLEGYLMATPLDSRALDGYTDKFTPLCNARFNYRFIFAKIDKMKERKVNFLTDNAYSYNTVTVHRVRMGIPHRRSFAIRTGLNGQLHAKVVDRSWDYNAPSDWYSVERCANSFGHIGLSTLKTFFFAFESKDFGGRQQGGKVGELYADLLLGLGLQAYGNRYYGTRGDLQSSFMAIPAYKEEATILRLGARIGAETRFNFARKPQSGALLGFELGRNPGFLGGNYYGELRFGIILMGRKE